MIVLIIFEIYQLYRYYSYNDKDLSVTFQHQYLWDLFIRVLL